VLKEPRPEDVGGHLGEDAPLLLVLLAIGVVILLARALPGPDAGVARVTCKHQLFMVPATSYVFRVYYCIFCFPCVL
jgi:hypothetical protein